MKDFASGLMELLPDIYAQCDTSGDLQSFLNVIGPALDELKARIDGITQPMKDNSKFYAIAKMH